MQNKLEKLEAIRGFAAIYVVVTHLADLSYISLGAFSFVFKFGQEAVMLFFILSGFVIHYSFQRSKNKDFTNYFKRRFFRIYIPLIIVFIVSYLLYVNYSKPLGIAFYPHLLGNLFMLQDLGAVRPNVITEPFLLNGPVWSLSYEWWFYMLYFLIKKYFKENSFKVVAILALISTVSYIIYPFFINRIFMYLIIWWAGVEIADLYNKKEKINFLNLKKVLLVMGGCSILLFCNWFIIYEEFKFALHPFIEFRHMTFGIIAIIMSLIWKKYNWFLFDKTLGIFTFVAPISYTIYISHYFLAIKPDYLSFVGNRNFEVIIGIFLCLIFSYIVERVLYPYLVKFVK